VKKTDSIHIRHLEHNPTSVRNVKYQNHNSFSLCKVYLQVSISTTRWQSSLWFVSDITLADAMSHVDVVEEHTTKMFFVFRSKLGYWWTK